MKIKLFVASETQYFQLGIISFNSYVYYLTRGFIGFIEKPVWCISGKENYYNRTKNNHKFQASVTERYTSLSKSSGISEKSFKSTCEKVLKKTLLRMNFFISGF